MRILDSAFVVNFTGGGPGDGRVEYVLHESGEEWIGQRLWFQVDQLGRQHRYESGEAYDGRQERLDVAYVGVAETSPAVELGAA